jgi:hypothetical protein
VRGEEQFAPAVTSVSTKHTNFVLYTSSASHRPKETFKLLYGSASLLFVLGSRHKPLQLPRIAVPVAAAGTTTVNTLFADYPSETFARYPFDPHIH